MSFAKLQYEHWSRTKISFGSYVHDFRSPPFTICSWPNYIRNIFKFFYSTTKIWRSRFPSRVLWLLISVLKQQFERALRIRYMQNALRFIDLLLLYKLIWRSSIAAIAWLLVLSFQSAFKDREDFKFCWADYCNTWNDLHWKWFQEESLVSIFVPRLGTQNPSFLPLHFYLLFKS